MNRTSDSSSKGRDLLREKKGFFGRIFSRPSAVGPEPDIRFGRWSDIYKKPERYLAWDKSLQYFEQKKYLSAYREFLNYLGDDREGNVIYSADEQKLDFICYQGSKKIIGTANRVKFKAEAKIAAATELIDASFFRDFLQRNFDLEYCRFALDEAANLTLVFDTPTLDGSPFKLYHALREMALQADKTDDLLTEKFPALRPINIGHIEELPAAEKKAKYEFAVSQIRETLTKAESLAESLKNYPGGIAYLLLSLCYRLDYLLTPQGVVTETLERIHRSWFDGDRRDTAEKNAEITEELTTLLQRPEAAWNSEFYRVISTFGIVPAFGHERVQNLIDAELPVFDWYAEHGFTETAKAIGDYIAGHSLFSFALPKYDRDFFHLYYRISYPVFFRGLGYSDALADEKSGKPNPKAIKRYIQKIVRNNEADYLRLSVPVSGLDFSNKPAFIRSFLLMIRNTEGVKG